MGSEMCIRDRQRVVSFYGGICFYTIHRAGPTLTARPETLIHGREGRVNTGWPSPRLVQKVFICDIPYQSSKYYFKFPFREEHIFFAVTRTERRGHLDGNKLIGLPGNHITQVIDAPVIFRLYTGLTTINLLVLRKL